jgi:hypothetical protein
MILSLQNNNTNNFKILFQGKTADVVILDVLDRNGVLRDDILLKTASML